jgi:hypothetical protein
MLEVGVAGNASGREGSVRSTFVMVGSVKTPRSMCMCARSSIASMM